MRQSTNDADSTGGRGLSTEQIAAAGTAPARHDTPAQADVPAQAGDSGYEGDNAAPLVADPAASGTVDTDPNTPATGDDVSVAADQGARTSLLEEGEQQSITARWKDIQAEFVDEPTKAVQQADALVAELMQRLAVMFATERSELENRWAGGNQVSTEDLRQGLRRYRSFFERLLAA